ncbi:MAG: discoidin domain-containing protein [Bdellovibrionales bacterium]|nr:discoidin domain-containing protein [Bdellovibrionales bacterium]
MSHITLDDFEDIGTWTPHSSGQINLKLTQGAGLNGKALKLDFDFKEPQGFVTARKELSFSTPDDYAICFDFRGNLSIKKFELKLIDQSGQNVWWYNSPHLEISDKWQNMSIKSHQIEFAWGPLGSNSDPITSVGAIELVFWADSSERGSIWIANLELIDKTIQNPPVVTASSSLAGYSPDSCLDPSSEKAWRSTTAKKPQWLKINFGEIRDIGGLVIHWDTLNQTKKFEIQCLSEEASEWKTIYHAEAVSHVRSYVYLPGTACRQLRFNFLENYGSESFGLKFLEIKNHHFSRSQSSFFKNVAHYEPRGTFPKYFYGEQSYWTVIGTPQENSFQALINEEGMVEIDKGSFSVEPFLVVEKRLVTWNDVEVTQSLEPGLPIPSVHWKGSDLHLQTTVYMDSTEKRSLVYIRYRLQNLGEKDQNVSLFALLRPFQVTPPWQSHLKFGGISRIDELNALEGAIQVNKAKIVIPLCNSERLFFSSFDQGPLSSIIRNEPLPELSQLVDSCGWASGSMKFKFDLKPNSIGEVYLAIPSDNCSTEKKEIKKISQISGSGTFQRVVRNWKLKLNSVEVTLPNSEQYFIDALKICAAHILINRDGPAFQPGPRRYACSWIRDGAVMAAAALRMGFDEEAMNFIKWYAKHQNEKNGQLPFSVDDEEHSDPPEHDNLGEFIFTIAECFRITKDMEFLRSLWPSVQKAIDQIEFLRNQRLTNKYLQPETQAFHGLLPESVSHEGYLFRPVHSHWDNFWTLRGLIDAAYLACALGELKSEAHISELCRSFKECLLDSVNLTIKDKGIDYFPGSVELADLDPSATAIVGSLLNDDQFFTKKEFRTTFEKYLADFDTNHRRDSGKWINFTPYEMRIIGTLVKMGRREESYKLLKFFIHERTPHAWNQWPEIVWRDLKAPAHIGDLPHSWVGAEFILSFLSFFAYEKPDKSLILAAGIPTDWLNHGGLSIKNLPTYFGKLNYTLRKIEGDLLEMSVSHDFSSSGVAMIIKPPSLGRMIEVHVNSRKLSEFDPENLTVCDCPAKILIRYSSKD